MRYTTENLIDSFRKTHGTRYIYTKVENKKGDPTVIINCRQHGEFVQRKKAHTAGANCPICAAISAKRKLTLNKSSKTLTYKQWSQILSHRYSKSPFTDIVDEHGGSILGVTQLNVHLMCPTHGRFTMAKSNLLKGSWCYKCGREKIVKAQTFNITDIAERLNKLLPAYTVVNGWKNANTDIKFKCTACGKNDCVKKVGILLRKNNTICTECANKEKAKNLIITFDEFLKRTTLKQKTSYSYDKTTYKALTEKMQITCKTCNTIFSQTPHNHLKGAGCPTCAKLKSGFGKSRFIGQPAIFYILKIGESYKIGITTKSIMARYKNDLLKATTYQIIFATTFLNGVLAWELEKVMLRKYANKKYDGKSPFSRTGITEILTEDPSKNIQTYIKELYDTHKT